jgi:myosin-1
VSGSSKPNIKKATFDTTKKKEVGVSDLTLISKVSNEAINDNLKKRFENREIYVSKPQSRTKRGTFSGNLSKY